jgi:signal transduction histidine kinase
MRISRHKRQIVLFIAAILVPAAVLIGLSTQLMRQEQELAAKRAADQRQASIEQLRRELAARLDAIRLQEINRVIRSSHAEAARDAENPAVISAVILKDDHAALPSDAAPPEPSAEFAAKIQEGEAQEFAKKDASAATAAYRQALAAARNPSESAEARLRLARTLDNSGHADEAYRLYQNLLSDASAARDPEGVGYRFYAAKLLLDSKRGAKAVKEFLQKEADGNGRLSLTELYMIRDLNGSSPRLSERISDLERVSDLVKDAGRIRVRVEAGAEWVPYGEEPWLVTVTARQADLPPLLLAVSSAKVAPPGVKLTSHSTEGDALGDRFPGIRVEWAGDQSRESGRTSLPVGIWLAGLALVLGFAIFGGYLLLRDVNRDVRMTEVRSQFVASVSHELKTPLTAIRMFAETLAMGRSRDEKTRSEYLETIVNESERLARLVDNVLDFSKIEQGKKIYRLRPTQLQEVADSAVRAMRFPLAQQGFTLNFSTEEDMPELEADADAIQQAILNLLTNAMKYSGDSREIDLHLAARNGDAVIEVIDRGLGLTQEEQKHIFEKFYRAPSHESRLIAGTGLGLTLVAHIAKAHHGRVEVESTTGAGSTFSIIIPLSAQPARAVVRDPNMVAHS